MMDNFRLKWTDADGPHVSAVSYDGRSANRRKEELEKAGATEIGIVPVKPGSDHELDAHVEGMTRELDQVLDVEAGLVEVLSAGRTVDRGLESMFRRLGPPAEK